MDQQNKLIEQFHKNSREMVEVHITEFKGVEYVDIRVWTLSNPADPEDQKPTHKGICINADLLPKLIKALQKAEKSLAQRPESDSPGRSVQGEGKK